MAPVYQDAYGTGYSCPRSSISAMNIAYVCPSQVMSTMFRSSSRGPLTIVMMLPVGIMMVVLLATASDALVRLQRFPGSTCIGIETNGFQRSIVLLSSVVIGYVGW